MSRITPILPCHDFPSIRITPSPSPAHPLQAPTHSVPSSLLPHLDTASIYLRDGQTVAFPTETVYGLGASSLDPSAVAKIYRIKNRPSDNPLIIHVSSLDMLQRLLPPPSTYHPSKLYMALITAFWPGPLTLLFPSSTPPPPPAPQTNAIRMPAHPLALALIHHADLPLSAPSANSSGRPSPTRAQHVFADLNGKEGLGCILDGGDCGVGVESTVVDGLAWKEGGGGSVDVLRPGGLGVEEIARIVDQVDEGEGKTQILVHGKPWSRNAVASSSRLPPARPSSSASRPKVDLPPSTPGMKYRHYSPNIPVYLLLPSDTFPRPPSSSVHPGPDIDPTSSATSPIEVVRRLSRNLPNKKGKHPRIGFLHFENSNLDRRLSGVDLDLDLVRWSLGANAEDAARRLFAGLLKLEAGERGDGSDGVDAILVEGCSDEGLGLAVMERVSKAVGGGGKLGDVHDKVESTGADPASRGGRFWVEV